MVVDVVHLIVDVGGKLVRLTECEAGALARLLRRENLTDSFEPELSRQLEGRGYAQPVGFSYRHRLVHPFGYLRTVRLTESGRVVAEACARRVPERVTSTEPL